jgi:uncharacterized protein
MKQIIASLLIILAITPAIAQKTNPNYDPVLAKKYGAEENGMKSYILVILKAGPNKNMDKAFRDSCFAGHMENIRRLAAAGRMIVAGPLDKNERNYRGIFILNAATFAEADSLLQKDPTVREKIFDLEMYNWYGSAALPAYMEFDDKVWKTRR